MTELHKFIEEEIEGELRGAYAAPSIDKKGKCSIFVAMGDDPAFQGNVPWKDFANGFLDGTNAEELRKFLPLVEKLARQMKKELELKGSEE